MKGRARWLKKTVAVSTKVVKDKEARAKQREQAKQDAEKAAQLQEAALTATKSVLPIEDLTPAVLQRRIQELAAVRGRRGRDPRAQLRELEALYKLSLPFGPRIEVPVAMYCIAAQFGLQRTLDDCMDTATWKSCAAYLQRIADVLEHEGYTLGVETVDASDLMVAAKDNKKMKAAAAKAEGGAMEAVAADEQLVNPHTGAPETEDQRAERLRLEKEATLTEEEKKVIPVVGSLSLHLSRLEEEYTKSLQKISHHSAEYIVRLRDESKLVELLARFQTYFEKQQGGGDESEAAAALAQLRIEHLYYRHDTIAKQVDKAALFYETYGELSMLHPACLTASTPEEGGRGDRLFRRSSRGRRKASPS